MKLKIRGLVFSGFAAAVFAQSALATQTDANTVTSKTYVDSKVEATVNNATTINSDSPDTKAPSSLNVYKYVSGQMNNLQAVANVKGDDTYLNVTEVTVTPQEGEPYQAKQVNIITGNLASTNTLITTGGTSGQAADEGKLTTAKAVYDFVTGDANGGGFQPKTHVGTGESNTTLKVGHGEGQWGVIQAYGQGNPSATNSYLEIQPENGRDVYNIGIVPSKIAQHGADGSSGGTAYNNQIVSGSDSLTTANAVYEYVQNNVVNGDLYQRKLANSESERNKVMIGYNSYNSSTTEYGGSDWQELAGSHYVAVGYDAEADGINVKLQEVTSGASGAGTQISGAVAGADSGKKLATAFAVKDYVDSITHGNVLPVMPSACEAANVHCALVATGAGTGQPVTYEWTVMAQ